MAVNRGIPRAVGGFRCSSPHLEETAGPAQENAYELRVYRPPRQREHGSSRAAQGARLTSLTLLIMLFSSCSSFSLFCWLAWWMICCHRKQNFQLDELNTRPSLRGFHTVTTPLLSAQSILTCLFARSSSLTLACSASCRLDFSLSTYRRKIIG